MRWRIIQQKCPVACEEYGSTSRGFEFSKKAFSPFRLRFFVTTKPAAAKVRQIAVDYTSIKPDYFVTFSEEGFLSMVKFAEGDLVWAADNGNLYLSKIIKATEVGKLRKYFIHFQGWNEKFDVWADEYNLVAQKDEAGKKKLFDSLQGIAIPIKEKKNSIKNESDRIEPTEVHVPDISNGGRTLMFSSTVKRKILSDEDMNLAKKRRRELAEKDLIDEHCGLDGIYFGKILIPLNIKKHLVDEWNLITGLEKRLLRLPRTTTVSDIFDEFLDEKKGKTTLDLVSLIESPSIIC